MSVVDRIHGGYVHRRRVRILSDLLAERLPPDARVLDVGCGDGAIAARIIELRPDVEIRGLDVLIRADSHIEIAVFDGEHIPESDDACDVVMFVDVLHHTTNAMCLLKEARRVAQQHILIKDHTREGLAAGATLRFMDRVGNLRHGVELPYSYWRQAQWDQAFEVLDVRPGMCTKDLRLYPFPASLIFDRSLHFVARLDLA